jgi:hypothetical protein
MSLCDLFLLLQELSQEWGWQAGSVAQVVSDPYPALQLLLEQDAAATGKKVSALCM